jgi:hypothetical protein
MVAGVLLWNYDQINSKEIVKEGIGNGLLTLAVIIVRSQENKSIVCRLTV